MASTPPSDSSSVSSASSKRVRVGIVGFGQLGQFIAEKLLFDAAAAHAGLELAFVWNRTTERLAQPLAYTATSSEGAEARWTLPAALHCTDLHAVASYGAHLIVEVAHPAVALAHGAAWLSHAALLIGSPAALSDAALESALRSAATSHPLLVPVGALWGAEDLVRMASTGALKALLVTMTFHPRALRPTPGSDVARALAAYEAALCSDTGASGAVELYSGAVRGVCAQAPNNVNTMACAALASGSALGFDKVRGTLRVDASTHAHIITVTAEGVNGFKVTTERINPAAPGAVTGNATFLSFWASLLRAASTLDTRRSGVHFV